jgi:uncharacterized protein (DUF697 family)/tellurite resistance protein
MDIPQNDSANNEALLTICLLAAFSDGAKSDSERTEVRRIAGELGVPDPAALARRVLTGQAALNDAAAALPDKNQRLLAYEMALGVCEADGALAETERAFLEKLRASLQLDAGQSASIEKTVEPLVLAPVATPSAPPPAPATDNGPTILKYAILNGALELLPDTLATMAIIPLQMKMVYGIGKSHGVEWDRSRIKEFLAVGGIGLGSQMVEGFARKLMGGFAKKLGGKMVGKAAGQITGSAFSFASTYAIGHLADQFHRGGGRLDSASAKQAFASLQEKARDLHARYLPEIQQKAAGINPASIMKMVAGSGPV